MRYWTKSKIIISSIVFVVFVALGFGTGAYLSSAQTPTLTQAVGKVEKAFLELEKDSPDGTVIFSKRAEESKDFTTYVMSSGTESRNIKAGKDTVITVSMVGETNGSGIIIVAWEPGTKHGSVDKALEKTVHPGSS